ncbi:MAG: FAD-dependent oxidoreductase [Pseudomonadota bacterium]
MSNKPKNDKQRIGIFICRCGGNISDTVDVEHLIKQGRDMANVEFTMWNSFTCSAEGQGRIAEKIKEHNLDSVIIGSCTPRQYEDLFRETIAEAGLNPYMLEVVNLREQCAYPHQKEPEKATAKATRLVHAAVEKTRRLEPLEVRQIEVSRDIAIIGAGIAGMHAASTLAKLGHQVHLVERETSVGGNMARVVKTFPTDDCAMCTLSPKMDEMTKNKKIHLMTNSEVIDVKKAREGLRVTVRRNPRYLDEDTCTGCGKCTDNCPAGLYNEYNLGLESTRKAIYKPFPAAVPNKYILTRRGAPPCRDACPVHQNAQGYVALIAAGKFAEAYDVIRRDNPLPSVCGRVCNHICETACSRGDDGGAISIRALKGFVMEHPANAEERLPELPEALPVRVAIVGGGPSGLACAHDLALHGIKATIFEASDEAGGVLSLSLPRYRLPREVLDRDIDYIRHLGVDIRTGQAVDGVRLRGLLSEYDAVYLAIGLTRDKSLRLPGHDAEGVLLGGAFLDGVKRGKPAGMGKSVLVIGGGNVAFDVARSAVRLGAKVEMMCLEASDEMPALPDEVREGLEEGIVIHNRRSPQHFEIAAGRVTGVATLAVDRIEIDELGRLMPVTVPGSDKVLEADTVVFAIGQGPDVDPLKEIGFDLNARGLIEVDSDTLRTGVDKLYAGGDAASGPTTVVAAMGMGRQAARAIARDLGHPIDDLDVFGDLQTVDAAESIALGHKAGHKTLPRKQPAHTPAAERVKGFDTFEAPFDEAEAIAEAARCLQCGGCADCRVCESVCEANAIKYDQKPEEIEILVGGVIVATGFKDYDPSKLNYGYGKFPNVITQFQMARMLDPIGPTEGKVLRPIDGKTAKRIVMVQCVGSRGDAQGSKDMHAYCSRVCCMVSLKHAGLIKKSFVPDAEITICYIDIRAFGKGYEEYYDQVKGKGVRFLKGMPARVRQDDATGDLLIDVEDQNTARRVELRADLVVLATATEPAEGIDDLRRMLTISRDESGFLKEFHLKIRPTDSTVKNVMIAGTAQGPKDITDTIAQAGSAAASLAAYIGDGFITLNPLVAHVDEERCRACGRCEQFCEFQAATVGPDLHAQVEEALCEGCGKCSVVCPTGAIKVYGAHDDQIESMMEALKAL